MDTTHSTPLELIIGQRAQNELRLAKEKVRRKTAIMSRQEEEVLGRERQNESLASQTRELSRLLQLSQEEAANAKVPLRKPCGK